MQTLTFSVSLPDAAQPYLAVHVSLAEPRGETKTQTIATTKPPATEPSAIIDDDYVLGGYAGI